ncbi:MAG TPA: hypothetical protein VIG88_03445 [Lysobacter sp.]
MIKPISDQEARTFRERLSNRNERLKFFSEPDDYGGWVKEIADFIELKGGSLAFGVEKYRGDVELFSADKNEEGAIMFLSRFAPLELVFFGTDWIIGISSYPESESSDALEYAIRLYGEAISVSRNDRGLSMIAAR